MRVIFDALGSTEQSGGMRLHSTELVNSWLKLFDDDDVIVVGGEWAAAAFEPRGARVFRRPNESILGRATGQLLYSPLLRVRTRADFVVSLSPIVSPLVPRQRAFCFQHDWRHKKNPHEFPLLQRRYRLLWEISAKHAATNICISHKAAEETAQYAPGSRTVVIENGYDHARSWRSFERDGVSPYVVTFGHHNNKRPELLIDALALTEEPDLSLVVLGAKGSYREELRERATRLGLGDRVILPGFVDDAEYQRFVAESSVVALVSSDEGFGLPIAEAQFLGIPAVVTSDSGLDVIFGSFPHVSAPDPAALAAVISTALSTPSAASETLHSWDDTARELRRALLGGVPSQQSIATSLTGRA